MARFPRCFSPLLRGAFFLLTVVAANAQVMLQVAPSELPTLNDMPACVPVAQSGYRGGECVLKIDRQNPTSPPALIVPPNTTVYVEIVNTRWNETVLFSVATTHTTPPDIAAAALKGAISPLQSLVLAQKTVVGYEAALVKPATIADEQKAIADTLTDIQKDIRRGAAALTCLAAYQSLQADYSCSQGKLLTPQTFDSEKQAAINLANYGAARPLPLVELKDLDTKVGNFLASCLANAAKEPADKKDETERNCRSDADLYVSNQAKLNGAVGDIQKAQAALLVSVQALTAWPGTPPVVAYKFTSSPLNNMVVTVSGQEVVNKTSSPIASVTINCQATHWVVSAGILFSNLKFHTFTNSPVIVNGQPVLDPTGKTLTRVTRSDTSPAVAAPELLVSYRISPLSRFGWENKCPNGCSFLLTGGIGANLTSKTADFDTGISFQIGGVLITPTVHFGRDVRLSNGVTVGQELGPSPPSPLPTENHWVRKFGIGLSYTLPTP